ncbi:MAG TPA: hypothetical protein VGM52_18670 [Herbaspirillum sp.]|jgi:hypothetical protein
MKFSIIPTTIALFGIAALSACERSPAEQLAVRHSEEQSRINTANFERNTQLREMKENAKEDASDSAAKEDPSN